MIDLAYFKGDAEEARRLLEAMGRAASEQTGHRCGFSLAKTLSDAQVARILELEVDAFGKEGVAFDRRALDEVRADPDALFLLIEIDGRLEAVCFGYWEWPDQVTVPGTDFFLDSAMISAPYRGEGIGTITLVGVMLLVRLLKCHRVGIAAWVRGPAGRRLVRFYRKYGFRQVKGAPGPHELMVIALDDAPVDAWYARLGLESAGGPAAALATGRGARIGRVWPRADERALLGRFYVAMAVLQALLFIGPFEFAYLYLAMERPDWAVIPVIVSIATAFVIGVPAALLADRWSRKLMVLIGGGLTGLTLALVPLAVRPAGDMQLVAACVVFGVMGVGESLMASAQEAWVVDNLHAAGRRDLVEAFFAHVRSVAALGAAVAAAAALVLLMTEAVSRPLLDLLWVVAGAGSAVAVLVAATIPERRLQHEEDAHGSWSGAREALRALVQHRALLMIAVAIVLAALSGAVSDDAFTVSLITKGFDARLFAPLTILDNVIGVVGPLAGVILARRLGATRLLAMFLALEALVVTVLFANRSIAAVLVLYVTLDFLDDVWDPVALARLQVLTPSAHRATISAIVYELGSMAQMIALSGFALMLGRHRAALEAATPDLLEAFSGPTHPPPVPPTGLFGLPVPDLAIVLFIGFGLLAVPFILASGRTGRTARPTAPEDDAARGEAAPAMEPPPAVEATVPPR